MKQFSRALKSQGTSILDLGDRSRGLLEGNLLDYGSKLLRIPAKRIIYITQATQLRMLEGSLTSLSIAKATNAPKILLIIMIPDSFLSGILMIQYTF